MHLKDLVWSASRPGSLVHPASSSSSRRIPTLPVARRNVERATRCFSTLHRPVGLPEGFEKLLQNNRKWAEERKAADPTYFDRLCAQQTPEYLWIGCADSRVPANVILGMDPGEIFTQRNVGNQASHTDLNAMSCLEYAVAELKVKTIILCGHYGCGAVRAALKLPSKTQGLVNCWISDIRECRNQNYDELKSLNPDQQFLRLCELNVMRQTFHVCTSPVVQNAWDKGQDVSVYGVIYDLKDGRLRKVVGPLSRGNASGLNFLEYENRLRGSRQQPYLPEEVNADADSVFGNTEDMVSRVALHVGWAAPPPQQQPAAVAAPQAAAVAAPQHARVAAKSPR